MIKYKKVWFCTVTNVTSVTIINLTRQHDSVLLGYAVHREPSARSLRATLAVVKTA